LTEGLSNRPCRSDFTPQADSEYARGLRKWRKQFGRWRDWMREDEWHWASIIRDLAASFDEYETLMQRRLPVVAKWARAEGRSIDS